MPGKKKKKNSPDPWTIGGYAWTKTDTKILGQYGKLLVELEQFKEGEVEPKLLISLDGIQFSINGVELEVWQKDILSAKQVLNLYEEFLLAQLEGIGRPAPAPLSHKNLPGGKKKHKKKGKKRKSVDKFPQD